MPPVGALPVLLARWPALQEALPRHPIVETPSPVERMRRLESSLGSQTPLWIKRDDRVGSPYGGNKPRKLEFILGRCLDRGARAIVTVGGLGSNHCLATAIYGRETGLRVRASLVDQPVTENVVRTVAQMASHGAHLHHSRDKGRTAAVLVGLLARELARSPFRPPMLVLPGGSVPLGTVGIVNAALELVEQAQAGKAPRPSAVYVALGSGGTHAGLLAGFRLAGWDVPVVGVRVNHTLRLDPDVVAGLARRCLALLRRHAPEIPEVAVEPAEVTILDGYLGTGYGHPTPEGDAAVSRLEETEGIALEETYTGKAMAAFLDRARSSSAGGPLLFWHTYNTQPLPTPKAGWERRLPRSLRRTLEKVP